MKLEISGEAVLSMVSDRLNHLLACRAFLEEVVKQGLDTKLIALQAKDKYKHNQTRLRDSLLKYQKLCRDNALLDEIGGRTAVQKWLDDVEELEATEDLVKTEISEASGGPYGDGLPRELNDRLRSLTDFDDSE